jgi:hypothetical protein
MTTNSKVDKEKLYEENLQLKNYINLMKKDFAFSKSENHKLEHELNKKEKLIEDLAVEGNEKMSKAKEVNFFYLYFKTHLIIGLKKQFKELQKDFKNKSTELDNLKKTIRNTKLNEINIELNTYVEELQKLKNFYEISLQQNAINE